MKPLETSVKEVLLHAIRSEVETRLFLQKLAERGATPEVRKRLLDLADDELLHRARLERRYRDRFGEMPPDPEPVSVELGHEVPQLDLSRALKFALERERDSESYYRFMAERADPESELGQLFVELAEVEWRHKTALQAEYDATGDPDRFLLDF